MIPGMNPREMQKAMKKLGITQEDIEATEVIIKTPDKTLIIRNPTVAKVNMMGQESLQVTGEIEELELSQEVSISDEDVQTVVEQTGASEEDAKAAIEKHNGDLAQAIIELKQ